MSQSVTCSACDSTFGVKPELAGKSISCPKCGAPISVPGGEKFDPLGPSQPLGQYSQPAYQPQAPVQPPRPVSPPASGGGGMMWLILGGAIGAVMLFVACCCGVPMGIGVLARMAEVDTEKYDNLLEARAEHTPVFNREERDDSSVPTPPPELFELEEFPSEIGPMLAYVGVDPGDGRKHPAIIWKFGGFGNGIDDTAWQGAPPDNDQSAAQYREAGIVMMYPSLRGGNGSPGHVEGFYGEVDDLLAARDYLASKPYVDPERIYLGGHSTGGTLVLLAAAATDEFRAVFSFGPVTNPVGYGPDSCPFNIFSIKEAALRSPGKWLHAIHTPTFIFEGDDGNIGELRLLKQLAPSPNIQCYAINNADHFNIIGPINGLLAAKIRNDTGPTCNIELTEDEVQMQMLGKAAFE